METAEKKEKKKSIQQQIREIEFAVELPKNAATGEVMEVTEVLPTVNGRERRFGWSWIKGNPVMAIKSDVRLARLTTATNEQIEKIQSLHPIAIQKLLKSKK